MAGSSVMGEETSRKGAKAQRSLGAFAPLRDDNYLTHTRGFRSWALTLDHKRIGIMYMAGILASFLLGGIFALLIRTELATPGPTIMGFPGDATSQAADSPSHEQ